jgi:putative GTP pyrophosphokinase
VKSFEQSQHEAIDDYRDKRHIYQLFVLEIEKILKVALSSRKIKVASVEGRAKTIESFAEKAAKQSLLDPTQPKYRNPSYEITDCAGLRIITFFPKTLNEVDQIIGAEFMILEKNDKGDDLKRDGRLGYQSIHYLISLGANRATLAEYSQFKDLIAEIQVRTILQHAWAEIEHDIQYKSLETAPLSIQRRFISLAGLLELADREFQSIHDEDNSLRQTARKSVHDGKLENVEITPDALKTYLDRKLGVDRRMTDVSYEWAASMLRSLSFTNFRQIDECISGFDDDNICRLAWGERQGQVSRFETLLLAGMGQYFIDNHPFVENKPWVETWENTFKRFIRAGIMIKNYRPSIS